MTSLTLRTFNKSVDSAKIALKKTNKVSARWVRGTSRYRRTPGLGPGRPDLMWSASECLKFYSIFTDLMNEMTKKRTFLSETTTDNVLKNILKKTL